jgi:predicted oxidoreductase
MSWGQWGKQLSTRDMQDLISHYLDLGISTFDHADIYGAYSTESEFGKAFKTMNIDREAVQLISKCGIQYQCEARDNKVKHYNYSKDYLLWSVDESLKNLQTDYLDLLLLHRPSPLMVAEEIAEAVEILKKQGKIRSFGVSNFSTSQMDLIGLRTDISYNQIEFSLTQHKAMLDGTLDFMMSNGIGAMSWSPLGSLFKEDNEQTQRIKMQLRPLMDKYKASIDQLLLAWIMKHPAQISPVIGTTSPERITLAQQACNITLDLEDWFLLLVASQGHKVP